MLGITPLAGIRQDLTYILRGLRRSPAFTLAAAATLAVGIGATTAVVSVVDGVLLRGLPYRDADRLVRITERSDDGSERLPSYPTFRDWQEQGRESVAGMTFVRGGSAMLRGENGTERLTAGYVTPGFFSLLGTAPAIGRTFRADEEAAGGDRVAVLSYALWQHRFAGDAAIVGRTVDIEGAPTTIVGVMPRGFAYPSWAGLWLPLERIAAADSALTRRGVHSDSRALLRLHSPDDSARVVSAFATLQARLAAEYPADAQHWNGVTLTPIRNEVLGDVGPMLGILAAAAALVLLLACVNVATLSLIRASVRTRELVVRAALGARPGRLVRQLFAESCIVALAGGVLGTLLAAGAVRYVRLGVADRLPRADEIVVDGRVLALALAVTALAAILVGAVPAIRATRTALNAHLQGASRGSTGGRGDVRVRGALVALQFALTVVLLVASGLLVQSFRRLQDVPLGFQPDDLVAIGISPPRHRYDRPADALGLYQRLADAARSVPGVRDAALVNHLPLSGASAISRVDVAGRPFDPAQSNEVLYRTASAEYLATTGMRLVRGRWLDATDMRSPDASGFVINERMARRYWPGRDPIGQVITLRRSSQARADFGQPISGPVVGVIADVHQFGQDADPAAEVFVPYTREVWPWITLVLRADHPERVLPALRRAVLGIDPDIPVAGSSLMGGAVTVRSLLSDSIARRRLMLALVGAFGASALLLATIGLYGTVAYSVAQRTREVGIRMALGATPASIARLVLAGGLRLAALGVALGLVGATAAARGMRALLFETTPTDPASYAAGAALLALAGLLAIYGPARRAVRVDPTVAMRDE